MPADHQDDSAGSGGATPWAIIALSLGMLGTVAFGGYAFGSLSTRVMNVESKVDDFKREVRDAITKGRETDISTTRELNEIRLTIVGLQNSQNNIQTGLNTLLEQHKRASLP